MPSLPQSRDSLLAPDAILLAAVLFGFGRCWTIRVLGLRHRGDSVASELFVVHDSNLCGSAFGFDFFLPDPDLLASGNRIGDRWNFGRSEVLGLDRKTADNIRNWTMGTMGTRVTP
jgi:hypothetical protein